MSRIQKLFAEFQLENQLRDWDCEFNIKAILRR
jgi:hypothetical protein